MCYIMYVVFFGNIHAENVESNAYVDDYLDTSSNGDEDSKSSADKYVQNREIAKAEKQDHRQRVYNTTDQPYRNICYLIVTFPDGAICTGSGTLVYNDVVLTAAHVVYRPENGGVPTCIEVAPAQDGYYNYPMGKTTAFKIRTHNEWRNNKNYNYDWAVLKLNKSFDTYQPYTLYADNEVEINNEVRTIGYSGDYNGNMATSLGHVMSANDFIMDIDNYIVEGDSGGAVIDTRANRLVGIVSASYRKGLFNTYTSAKVVKLNIEIVKGIVDFKEG